MYGRFDECSVKYEVRSCPGKERAEGPDEAAWDGSGVAGVGETGREKPRQADFNPCRSGVWLRRTRRGTREQRDERGSESDTGTEVTRSLLRRDA